MAKNILLIYGNPKPVGFCHELTKAYEKGAQSLSSLKVVHIADLQYDPILHHGYDQIQPLEPDLVQLQQNILWADHIVMIYPTWWGAMPARFKGIFDRAFLPSFIELTIRDGGDTEQMPAWSNVLNEQQIKLVGRYIRDELTNQ